MTFHRQNLFYQKLSESFSMVNSFQRFLPYLLGPSTDLFFRESMSLLVDVSWTPTLSGPGKLFIPPVVPSSPRSFPFFTFFYSTLSIVPRLIRVSGPTKDNPEKRDSPYSSVHQEVHKTSTSPILYDLPFGIRTVLG